MRWWPFSRKTPEPEVQAYGGARSPAKKLALISVKDYPRDQYSTYWEIGVAMVAGGRWRWVVNILTNATSERVNTATGVAATEHEARFQSQSWVAEQMKAYRIEPPKPEPVTEPQVPEPEGVA